MQEALTGISFDSFYNGFIDSLSDMDASFEDMCDDFEGYLRKSIIAGLIASQYKGRIENLYKSWTEAAESENKITAKEAEKLRDDYQDIIQDMIKDRGDGQDGNVVVFRKKCCKTGYSSLYILPRNGQH